MRNKLVHYQTNRKFLLIVGSTILGSSLLLLLGCGIFLSTRSADNPSLPLPLSASLCLLPPLLLMLCVIAGFMLGMANTKIVTSSEGVELHQFGFCTQSPWSNVARIAPFQSGTHSAYALYFYQPAQQFLKILPSIPIASLKMIPLDGFQFDADSELGIALRWNKPDLFR
ncbi:MAG: hypothetical protein B0A82_12060 [Alkalinema sp. CACIAM 70d]|nr:MAG: hypothetical protein B0A82_12060 [Alkalinema sp. CACIAM 70d]